MTDIDLSARGIFKQANKIGSTHNTVTQNLFGWRGRLKTRAMNAVTQTVTLKKRCFFKKQESFKKTRDMHNTFAPQNANVINAYLIHWHTHKYSRKSPWLEYTWKQKSQATTLWRKTTHLEVKRPRF